MTRRQIQDRGALARLIAANTNRPLLIRQEAVGPLMGQLGIHQERPSRLAALGRMFGMGATNGPPQPMAWDDYDDAPPRAGTMADWLGEDLRPTVPGLSGSGIIGEGWGYVIADGGIAIIGIEGALPAHGGYYSDAYHGYDTISRAHGEAQADGRVRGVMMLSNTPGGVVHDGLNALADELRTGDKPLWTFADMACSAGYWMASASDRILSGQYGQTGSIGVVIVHQNMTGALAQAGVEIETIEFPANAEKTAGAWWKALSETTRADLQADIDQIGADFIAAVVAGRPSMDSAAIEALGARVFMGAHRDAGRSALSIGLIDEIAPSPMAAIASLVASLPTTVAVSVPADPLATPNRADAARPKTPEKEADMALRNRLSAAMPALRAAAPKTSAEDQLKAIQDILDAPDEDEEDLEEDDADVSDDVSDDEEEGDPMATAQAIMNLPEAKGRDALARVLAFQKGATVAGAKAALGAAPKGRTMGPVPNPELGAGGESGAGGTLAQQTLAIARQDALARQGAAPRKS
jgi:ClpP class serine protease